MMKKKDGLSSRYGLNVTNFSPRVDKKTIKEL